VTSARYYCWLSATVGKHRDISENIIYVVKNKHSAAKAAFLDWVANGRPRNGYSLICPGLQQLLN